jgi:ubiquitin-conjugating enzyme E2 variant
MDQITPFFLAAKPGEIFKMRLCVGGNIAVLAGCLVYLALQAGPSGVTWPAVLAALLVGYFLADFASGVVHWGLDTWFDDASLGRAVAIAREHHTHPQHILGYGFLEHAALGSFPSLLVIGPAALATALSPAGPASYCLMIVWALISGCLLFGTSFHNLGHRPAKSRAILLLQRLRLVVTPNYHWVHHRSDQVVRYCVINGWANYPCDKLRVWRGMEWVVRVVTGARPRFDDHAWQRQFRETGRLVAPK